MTISHSIPSTTRQPGQFHEFDLLSGAQGLTPLANRVLLLGERVAAGSAAVDEAVQIFDEADSDDKAGKNSILALMARKALETGRLIGIQPEIWISPVADPAGTAATYTITTVGTATASADIIFRVGEVTLRAGISSGDDETAVALAIKAAGDAASEEGTLPGTWGVAAGVATFTLANTGVNGNDLAVTTEGIGLSGLTSVVAAAGVTGIGVVDPATALANSLAKFYEVKALSNHTAADITALLTHTAAAWAPAAKRWTFCFVGETGTLATANGLSAAANSERIGVIGYEGSPSLPGQIAAAVCTAISARELPNYNWDAEELPLSVPLDALVFTDTEIESALAAGTTPLAPNDQRTFTEIVRLITTKTLEGGAPFENAKDLATIRGLVFTTRQLDTTFAQQFKAVNKSTQVIKRMRSVAFNVLTLLEELGVLQNVLALFPQLIVERDPTIPTRAVVSLPESIIPNLHQIIMKHVLFVE